MMQQTKAWNIISSHAKQHGMARHQIASYNHFLTKGIQQIVDQECGFSLTDESIDFKYTVTFGQVHIPSARMVNTNRKLVEITPAQARVLNLYYESPIMLDITETYEKDGEIETISHRRTEIGRVPIMLGCCKCILYGKSSKKKVEMGECENDPQGYFIIKGNERVLVAQLRGGYNKIIVSKKMKQTTVTKVKKKPQYIYTAEMRSMSEETGHSVCIQAIYASNGRTIAFSLHYIKSQIPVGVVFKALGILDDKTMASLIGMTSKSVEGALKTISRSCRFIKTQEEALAYIGKFSLHTISKDERVEYARQIVDVEIFPHLGISSTSLERATLLGYMVNQLLSSVFGIREYDDIDNYTNKRVEDAGTLCLDLTRTLFKQYIGSIKNTIEKKARRPDIMSVIGRENSITKGLRYCFGTGNWGVRKNAYIRQGVCQILCRMTFASTLSHLRRLSIPGGKEGQNSKMRGIHTSQLGFICPVETPEGKSVGVVLNMSFLARISIRMPTVLVRELLETNNRIIRMDNLDTDMFAVYTYVFINGIVIGMTSEPEALTSEIRKYRQCKLLNYDVSISYCDIDRRIDIFADNGRIVRPLLVVENGKLLAGTDHFDWDWDKLVASGIIRYVDNSEVENYHVAMTFAEICNTTEYCEIHPSMIMGIMGNMIPFPDHSPSPRNCYQSSMGKQALGIPTLSYRLRVDTLMHILNNIQKAVVTTQAAEIMGLSKMPSGINAIVAIMSYGGANQEDGLLLSKSSTERGLFLATTYRTFPCEEKRRDGNESEHIQLPDKEIRRRGFNYSYLDHRGVVRKGVLVKPTDILVGKVIIKIPKDGDREIEDASLRVTGDGGIVDDVIYEIAPNGYVLVKVTLRNIKWPERGDKFASRQAQKGTVGGIVPNADLPFTSDGITPDIIINPHAMPSRMTLNQLLECVLGKASCLTGTIGDATPFQESSHNAPKIVGDILMSMGYQRDGNETMYNGCTGEMLEGQVFIGPTYYQRLKHMVSDKMHSRAEGQVTAMTRQPREGRSRDGGLRFGEMERDCEIVQGASRFLKERLHDVSDPFKITVCDDCGHVSSSINECRVCGEDRMLVCNIPYATKLLINELQAMHMKTLITVTN